MLIIDFEIRNCLIRQRDNRQRCSPDSSMECEKKQFHLSVTPSQERKIGNEFYLQIKHEMIEICKTVVVCVIHNVY